MKTFGGSFELTATDLVGYLNCRHLTELDQAVALGTLGKPAVWDPLLDILRQRGTSHEQSYLSHLEAAGLQVAKIEGAEVNDQSVAATLAAMKAGSSIIAQGALSNDGWIGRADILRRIDAPSTLGEWSYEVIDAKLARETKAGTVLQLCLYSDLLGKAQGVVPEHMYVVAPWSNFVPQQFRFADYAAYFRKVKLGLSQAIEASGQTETYPDPKAHCDLCRWRQACDKRRRDDDNLCLVAGITKLQIDELSAHGIATVKALATLPTRLQWKPERGSIASYGRVREQARIQVESREAGAPIFELLPIEPGFGLCLLPTPSHGDIFLDFEADPFVGEHGLEYLLGYLYLEEGKIAYVGDWALSRGDEKRAFERFVDFVVERQKVFPDLHIYHYAPYEPAALKRLMGRYATREEELDQFLRSKLFVDLYGVVRHAIRAGVESYSIKKLEPFYEFNRDTALGDASLALARLQASLELADAPAITDDLREVVQGYNRDDCRSAYSLRDWLEGLRDQVVGDGTAVSRPLPGDEAVATENVTAWLARVNELIGHLTVDIPADVDIRTGPEQARWILANIIDWHRREQKAVWWDYFRLAALSADELIDERAGLSGLTFLEPVGGTAKAPIHRYQFIAQETELRGEEDLRAVGGDKFGTVASISFENRIINIKKRQDTIDRHPEAVFAHKYVDAQVLAEALFRLGQHVADNGIEGDGPYQAGRDLLLKHPPRVGGAVIQRPDESTVQAAVRLAGELKGGILPIQGPPGAGKTYTGARMICELVRLGKTVGVTANSHKVIRNLLGATIKAADELGIHLECCQKADEAEQPQHRLSFAKTSKGLLQSLGQGYQVAGGTAWLWAMTEAFEAVDVLFVDEAAQMSLANVLAVSQAAKTVVLIGDPQQLDQPTKGSHPDRTDLSALHHILAGEQTIAPEQGLFLEETWRLHPAICAFTSELFYAGKLRSKPGLEAQTVNSDKGPVKGSGLVYLPVAHSGNQNSSPEEAEVICQLVTSIVGLESTWTDGNGQERPIGLDDILIITPYNAQVFELGRRLPNARIGTVDKFQGQEAPVAIYSMATSTHADAPRGMEFLYSLNRFNVATSRAKCLSILVCSPRLFETECKTPRQMTLANAFCRYLELAPPTLL